MKKVIRLTESDLTRLVRRVIKEQEKDALFGGPNRKFHLETQKVSECLKRDGWDVTMDSSGIMTATKESPYTVGGGRTLVKSTPEAGQFDLYLQYKPDPGKKNIPSKMMRLVVDLKTMNDPFRLCRYITDNATEAPIAMRILPYSSY
jgi:ATP sulfurylase